MKKTKGYKGALMILSLFVSLSIFTLPVWAADTDQVTATVTVLNLAVSVSPSSVNYGTIAINATEDTTINGINNSITATNDGNITANLNIKGADSTNWTLSASAAGVETFTHKFCTTDCDGTPTWTALNNSTYDTLATSVAAAGTQVFDLQIATPTSTTYYTQQSTTVTVQIVQP
jgi:hypothetical protein